MPDVARQQVYPSPAAASFAIALAAGIASEAIEKE